MNPEYDKNAWYEFTDQNGERHVSRGDNGYIYQSVTQGIPIYVNDNGDWFTTPYLEVTPTGYVANLPAWFKNTDEYSQWQQASSYAMSNLSVTKDNFNKLNDTLKALGNQGLSRITTYNQAGDVGISDPVYKQFVFDQYLGAMNEGAGNGDANLVAYGSTEGSSAADFARSFKNMSKEELSQTLLRWEDILNDRGQTKTPEDQKANVLAAYKVLNLIADNPSEFGDGEEFKGLLEASEWQKFQAHINNVIQTISEGMPIVTFGARLGSVLGGGDWQIENRREQPYGYLRSEATGGGLRGVEGSEVSGTVAGSIVNMAGTMAQSVAFGKWLNSTALGSSVGAALNGANGLAKLGGGMLFDFFANDLPVDLSLFAADLASTGSGQEAWESQTGQTQPLFGLFGPEVPAGLKYNLIGDALMDLTLPIISIGSGAMYKKLDQVTGGTVSKIRNKVALKNLAIQDKISEWPVIGTGLRKFSDWLMGAETTAKIRDARKEAIIKGSMTPYIDMQNLLTLQNHAGAEVVAPLYAKKTNELNINERIKEFQKNANEYGGMGAVKAETKTLRGTVVETVKDDIPRDVKQGLLDYQRLEELKGEVANEGDLISNPKRDKEIAELEKKVAEMPEKIKSFAEDFSELNKYVEWMGVQLGLTTQEWVDALLQDPRWKNYMTRQVLLPGGVRRAGAYDPATNKLLTGKRTGYYNPEQTLSPVMSLDMKVHAIGNAYAWNEQAKAIVAAEISQGKISAGGSSVDLAKRISEKRAEIMQTNATNAELGYDAIVNGINDRMNNLSASVRKINEKMQGLDNVTAKSVYTDGESPEIKGLVADFNSGKLAYGEGVLEGAGLSPEDGKTIVSNTYKLGGDTKGETVTPKVETPRVDVKAGVEAHDGSLMAWLRDREFDPNNPSKDYDAVVREKINSLPPELKKIIEDNSNYKRLKESGRYGEKAVLDHLAIDFSASAKWIDDQYRAWLENGADITSASEVASKEKYYAGMTANGTPYRYTINNGKIASVEKITDAEGLAESLHGINKNFSVSPSTIEVMGEEYATALNRAAMFFRDNLPNIGVESSFRLEKLGSGVWGQVVSNPHVHVNEDGTITIDFKSVLSTRYYSKGQEGVLRKSMEDSVKEETRRLPGRQRTFAGSWHPKNTVDSSQAPIHEATHTLMLQLTMLEENLKIKAGTKSYLRDFSLFGDGANRMKIYNAKCDTEASILNAAAARIGATLNDDLRGGISAYALWPRELAKRNAETITEAMVDYAFNGNNAAPFSQAIVQEVSSRLQKHSMSVDPGASLKANDLDIPKGLVEGGDYAFPASAKTQSQKAEWLNEWRQKNPYLKGEMTEETFRKANLWDSYFQKEVFAYDPNAKSDVPDELLKKSGDFVEKQRAQMAKDLTDEIKKLSGEFDSDLAMILMGGNGDDIAAAMDSYVIRQIDAEAEKLAAKMEGGATPENLATAKLTLWSDESVKQSTLEMFQALVPDGGDVVTSKVNILFDDQAKGFAAYEKLPVDSKELMAEKEALVDQLYKENKKALKAGKAADRNSGFRGDVSHVIHYKEGGEDVYVVTSDPVIANALKKPYNFKETGIITETMQTIANTMATTYRLGTTGINPVSFIRNVLRDPLQAMVTAGFNPLNMSLSPETFYKTLRQYGLDDDTIAQVSERIRNWARSSTLTEEMRLGPGRANLSYKNRVEQVNNAVRKVTNGKVISKFEAPLETWESFFRNQVGQQSFVKNFQRTGNVDTALSSALFDTSNATTNFSHAIGKFKNVTSTIPYLSSAVNGTVSFWRLFNIDPVGMITRISAGFMLPVMAITMWNLSSDENRKAYETLPEWFKQSHIVLTDPSGNVLAFPLPEEIQQFAGTARKLIEFTHEVSPYSIATIAAQGALGFLPFEVDGFWGDDGSLQLKEGGFQLLSGLIPQAFTTLYEFIWKQDLFTGQDLSTYDGLNQTINTLSNIFGTGIKQAWNSIGIMVGGSESDVIGKSFQNTIARDLFGMGFDAARDQFMSIVGKPAQLVDGKMTKATGLFAENEDLKAKIDRLSTQIATAPDDKKEELEEQKQQLVNEFTERVKNVMDKYQRMFSLTGGLADWQKNRLVQLLTLGDAWSSGESDSYQAESASETYLNERGLAMQRYVQAGLPAGADQSNLVGSNSIEIQAALNRLYGGPKQAATDYRNAVSESGLKDIRNEFYNVISQIYDAAEEQNKSPDYDMIEKIQARYLQAVDAVLAPIINQYGISVLNNNDFIDAVRKQVNGMIPSDDWRQSVRNAKKFLSSKDFPTTAVDVKKWLIQRYTGGMKDRGIASDQEVVDRLEEIREDIDAGRRGSAQGKVKSLMNGINKANFYISADDLQLLTQYNNMLK